DLCRVLMSDGYMRYTTIGKWWSRNEEIDIVALDEETKTAYFAECKWSNKKVGEDIYQNLVRKSHLTDWFNDTRTNRFVLFSKSGFTRGMIELARKDNVLLVYKDRTVNHVSNA
ncbi:MAG: DUF234 domain-containing protein, partial [Burkholderiales bacterium]|nr:DUF234 domain-containing protein [Burkholderiales bacterium]